MFGEQRNLADLSATLDILAHQVALTLESIMLRQEVIRQRNEAYFRALVQDASDAIVIVADDGTVKYATPSTTAIFGDITVEGEHLWDLVAEEDRDEFARTFMRLRERARFGPRVVEQGDHPPGRPRASTSRPGAATCGPSRTSPAWSSRCGT